MKQHIIRKVKIIGILLLLWPVVFVYLFYNPPDFTLSLHDNYQHPDCSNMGADLDLEHQVYGCICPAIYIAPQGFPVLTNGYGSCGMGEKDTAKKIDLAVLFTIELSLLALVMISINKNRTHKFN